MSSPSGVKMHPSVLEGLHAPIAGSRKAGNCFTHLDSWEPWKKRSCGFPGCQILLIRADSFPYACTPRWWMHHCKSLRLVSKGSMCRACQAWLGECSSFYNSKTFFCPDDCCLLTVFMGEKVGNTAPDLQVQRGF